MMMNMQRPTKKKQAQPMTINGLTGCLGALSLMLHRRDPDRDPTSDESLILDLLSTDATIGIGPKVVSVEMRTDAFGPHVAPSLRKPYPKPYDADATTVLLDLATFLAIRLLLLPGKSIFVNSSSAKADPLDEQSFYVRIMAPLNFTVLRLVGRPRSRRTDGRA